MNIVSLTNVWFRYTNSVLPFVSNKLSNLLLDCSPRCLHVTSNLKITRRSESHTQINGRKVLFYDAYEINRLHSKFEKNVLSVDNITTDHLRG
jgi:hypothetical protein